MFLLLKKVLSASSYGHFTAAKEFRSQCHIFRFGNIGYCCEIDIFMDQNIAYCCEIDIFIDQNIAYCCEIDISRLKKAALGDFSGSPGFLRIPPGFHPGSTRVPPGFHPGSTGVFGRWIGLYRGGFGRYLVEVRFP